MVTIATPQSKYTVEPKGRKRLFVYYHDDPEQNLGSAATFVITVCKLFSKKFAVDLFVYSDRRVSTKSARGDFSIHKIPRTRIPLISHPTNLTWRISGAIQGLNPQMYVISKSIGTPDICLCVDPYAAIFPALFSKRKGIPVVYRPNDGMRILAKELWSIGHRPLSVFVRLYGVVIESGLLRASSLVLPSSKKVAKECRLRFRTDSDFLVMPPLPPKVPKLDKQESRKTLGIPLDRTVLIFVGSGYWLPNQGAIEYIIDQLGPYLAREAPESLIYIVGQGTEYVRTTLSDNVRVIGRVATVDTYLHAADIGLAPMGFVGGIAAKAVEYLSFGLPVAATPNVAESLEPQTGVYIAPIEEFHHLVLDLVQSNSLPRKEAITLATERAYSKFSMDELLTRVSEIAEDMSSRKHLHLLNR